MHLFRSFAAGAALAGALTCGVTLGAHTAAAATVAPIPGGVEVNLTHDDTVWVSQNKLGTMVSSLPNPAAGSFGQTLNTLSELASQYPQGRVAFTVVGPFDNLNGTMVALEQ
ncbi:MAG: hypothetical protein HOQ24_05390 [Mycobacteriaceae bacterium]|nr:hypothetical protein [Mycobacteriaceae bacterium]